MRLYGRGIRRRLAPMLNGDRRRIELAYALQFSLPGSPVVRYGEEIGMGENLTLDGREAIRTPMQWDDTRNGGFSSADPKALIRPVPTRGRFTPRLVNVRAQPRDTDSTPKPARSCSCTIWRTPRSPSISDRSRPASATRPMTYSSTGTTTHPPAN